MTVGMNVTGNKNGRQGARFLSPIVARSGEQNKIVAVDELGFVHVAEYGFDFGG